MTMQMMPKISWPQRVASDAVGREDIAPVVLVIIISSLASVPAISLVTTGAAPIAFARGPSSLQVDQRQDNAMKSRARSQAVGRQAIMPGFALQCATRSDGARGERNPMRRDLPNCCARAESGHAAAP